MPPELDVPLSCKTKSILEQYAWEQGATLEEMVAAIVEEEATRLKENPTE